MNSYTHQNGKVEGEAVGNLDRLLEWNTIHVGTDTTEHEEIKGEIISTIRVYSLKTRYTFPQSIAVTHERPEIVSWNASSVHMVELTIPLETGAENAIAMKQIRNAELVDSGTQDSYQATHNP